MPHVSRETAPEQIAFEGLEVRLEHLEGGGLVGFRFPDREETLQAAGAGTGSAQ